MKKIIETENLVKIYDQGASRVFANNEITLSIEEGEFVAILGSSGSGKTTFLNLVGGIEKPTSGKILINGQDISVIKESKFTRFRAKNIGYVFQNYQLIGELNVEDNIHIISDINNWAIDHEYEQAVIDLLGIRDLLAVRPDQLSGGQQQRVAIARALVGKPAIVLADEPTGNLDKKRSEEIVAYLRQSNREYGQTFLIVTHDPMVAAQCSRQITLEDGKIVGDNRI
ncbi:MAG: ABC transporter ATP-binding protein [Lachnospiraceae bacterium]|nr:ABC transporter ATP-binding protein [Lachnospiraceae bacterium]MCH4069965.1 ABC transporter ATP-binding protein [Lachnospiraceae bacterium]MCH4108682.1 ABC transporter ATP-binding protein [Lachnospiraceae bacterium]MCI1302833.1 ABC transporter ATP-binding protein [Lachnospiraceae bacterium]MCI1332030.1 ABC transporter ATP-binding protein [Lachnospiraceae bacterium]